MATTPQAPEKKPHAGVSLDVHGIESVHHAHEQVEPIPWKTGAVGAVPPLDEPRKAMSPADGDAPAAKKTPPPKKEKKDPKLPGSGIPPRKSIAALKWVRRASQVGFFGLFMYFLFQTGFRGTFAAQADTPVRLP